MMMNVTVFYSSQVFNLRRCNIIVKDEQTNSPFRSCMKPATHEHIGNIALIFVSNHQERTCC
jgi:hypothetical protein